MKRGNLLERLFSWNSMFCKIGTYVPVTSGNRTVKTDEDGKYTFSGVSTYAEINGEKVLAHYRLKLLSLPAAWKTMPLPAIGRTAMRKLK